MAQVEHISGRAYSHVDNEAYERRESETPLYFAALARLAVVIVASPIPRVDFLVTIWLCVTGTGACVVLFGMMLRNMVIRVWCGGLEKERVYAERAWARRALLRPSMLRAEIAFLERDAEDKRTELAECGGGE